MTRPDDRSDLEQAAREAAESQLRAQMELQRARERAGQTLWFARVLKQLREDNGFHQIFEDAFGGGHSD